jgi:hypothetical protein
VHSLYIGCQTMNPYSEKHGSKKDARRFLP